MRREPSGFIFMRSTWALVNGASLLLESITTRSADELAISDGLTFWSW